MRPRTTIYQLFVLILLKLLSFSVSSAISSGDSTDQVAEQPAPNHTTLKAQREQQIELFALIFAKIITGVLCTAGILANLINVTVLTRSWMVYSTNVYLTAVAVCDLAYLVFSALFSLQLYARMRTSWLYMNALPFIYGSANSFSNTTTWLTVGFTVERYIAISSPIWGHRMCTRRRARTVVYVTVTICLLLTLPDYFSARIDAPVSEAELVSQTDSNDSKQHRRGEYRVTQNTTVSNFVESFGYTYINQACFLIVPLILLLVFNLLLIRSVYQASRERKNLTRADTCKAYSLTSGGAILSSSTVPRYNLSTMHRPGIKASLDADTSTQLEAAKPVKFDRTRCNQVGSGTFLTGGNPETNTGGLRRPILGEQHRITIMLIAIVMAFIVLQLPSIFPIIINAVVKIEVNVNSELLHFRSLYVRVSNTLLLVNAAMNFVFYSLFSVKFRKTCRLLFGRMCCLASKKAVLDASLRQSSLSVYECSLLCCCRRDNSDIYIKKTDTDSIWPSKSLKRSGCGSTRIYRLKTPSSPTKPSVSGISRRTELLSRRLCQASATGCGSKENSPTSNIPPATTVQVLHIIRRSPLMRASSNLRTGVRLAQADDNITMLTIENRN